MTVDDLDKIFSALIPQLKKILAKTLAQGRFREKHPVEDLDDDVEALKQVNEKLRAMLGMRARDSARTFPPIPS